MSDHQNSVPHLATEVGYSDVSGIYLIDAFLCIPIHIVHSSNFDKEFEIGATY